MVNKMGLQRASRPRRHCQWKSEAQRHGLPNSSSMTSAEAHTDRHMSLKWPALRKTPSGPWSGVTQDPAGLEPERLKVKHSSAPPTDLFTVTRSLSELGSRDNEHQSERESPVGSLGRTGTFRLNHDVRLGIKRTRKGCRRWKIAERGGQDASS